MKSLSIQKKGIYRVSLKNKVRFFLTGSAIGVALCWLAYDSFLAAPLGSVFAAVYCRICCAENIEAQKRLLLSHFRDFISSLLTALRSGYSVENGLVSAQKDIEELFGEKDTCVSEIKKIVIRMKTNRNAEELFAEFGERSQIRDIEMFAELLVIAKRTGGNMSRLLSDTAGTIYEKIDTKLEIENMLTAKILEQKIMSLMPMCIILYLKVTFNSLTDMLYGNTAGIAIMTVCMAIYLAAWMWGRHIVRIEV